MPEIRPNTPIDADIAFKGSAERYANLYSGVTRGYIISEQGILASLIPHLRNVQKSGRTPLVLEIGAGTGQSTKRLKNGLILDGVNTELITTEFSEAMINQGIGRGDADLPQIAAAAEYLPFPDTGQVTYSPLDERPFKFEGFDAVYGSQTIHWWKDVAKGINAFYRVLRPGGIVVLAASGILSGYGGKHFTEHPAYKRYLENVSNELRIRGLWREGMGEFTPINQTVVNPFFHRHSIDDIITMMVETGFNDVQRHEYNLEVDKQEILNRMGAGAASMFIFAGNYAKNISAKEREAIVTTAIERLKKESPELLNDLDIKPTNEPIPVFVGKKPYFSENTHK